MDRQTWLAQRQAAVVADYDGDAANYDDLEYPAEMQHAWVRRVLEMIPPGGAVLDAPCGTGRYFALITGAGMQVTGADQSAGMLAQARARGLAVSLEHCRLQDLSYEGKFDAALTIDALENVPPEDYPTVLANLRRAVRPGGVLYITVEEQEQSHIDDAFASLSARGMPAVHGEVVEGNVAGYHYYPGRERVLGWLADAGLDVIDEAYSPETGWGYRHFLVRAPG
ncbi:MAG TPA: methyltransferase domain-containing protein [Streptosporangiaceae bacterium]|nr:methyltransferase domain-containing protein [Streptosporangiaceae bacterium]